MAQTFQARFVQEGASIDHTPGSAVSAGAPVILGDLIGVPKTDIAANKLGAIAITGVFDLVKVTGAVSIGDRINWDPTGDPEGGTAGTGAATTALGPQFFGVCVKAAASGGEFVQVLKLNDMPGESIKHTVIPIETLAAGVDIAARPEFVNPAACELVSVGILTKGAPTDIDDSNTSVIAIKDDAGNTIVTKTYDTGTQPPTSDYEDLGALDATHKVLAANEHVTVSVTNGTTAAPAASSLIFTWK